MNSHDIEHQQHVNVQNKFIVVQQQQFDVFEKAYQAQAKVVTKNDVFCDSHIDSSWNHVPKTKLNQVPMENVA